jgi:hypothetical protein
MDGEQGPAVDDQDKLAADLRDDVTAPSRRGRPRG